MSAIKDTIDWKRQAGVAAVEVALVMVPFLLLVFGIMEVARSMFIVNTLQEVTRRAAGEASNTRLGDAAALALVRQHAIFRNSAGTLILSEPITDQNVRIDYLALIRQTDGSMSFQPIPTGSVSCPARNRMICLADPNSPNCVRFVRAQICAAGDGSSCNPVGYQNLFSFVNFPMALPRSETIVAADTLGFVPGTPPCP